MAEDNRSLSSVVAALKAERDRLTIIADAIQAERDSLRQAINQAAEMLEKATTNDSRASAVAVLRSALHQG